MQEATLHGGFSAVHSVTREDIAETYDDHRIASACAAGDSAIFEFIYRQYGTRMKSIAYQHLGSVADAEDAVQETFLKIHRAASTYSGEASFSTWAFRILINTCYDLLRKRRRRTDDAAIDPIYLERPYYLAPDGPVAREAFAVIREGMKGKAGIGKVALYGREYLVKVQPRDKGLVMYTLRHANEIRSMDAIDELSDMPAKVKPEEVKLAHQVIGTFEGEVDLQEYRDDYQVGLRDIIDAKIEGREIVAPEVEAPPKVVNLMDALRKSLDTISANKKPAATVSRMAAPSKKRIGAGG